MTQKRVSVRLVAEGGQLVRAEFAGIGEAGETSFRRIGHSADSTAKTLTRVAGVVSGALAAALSVRKLADYADTWSDLRARVDLATASQREGAEVMSRLADVADRSWSALDLTVETWLRSSTALRELGMSTAESLDYMEALNLALVASGARGERAATVQNALSNAMALGKLSGQNLLTVLQQGGVVTELLAAELGVSTNQLRRLGSEGRITGDVIRRALSGNLDELRERVEGMNTTIGDGAQRIQNATIRAVGAFDEVSGASARVAAALVGVANVIDLASDHADRLAAYAAAAGVALALSLTPQIVAATLAGGRLVAVLVASRAALIRTGWGIAVVGLGELAWRMGLFGDAADTSGSAQERLNAALAAYAASASPAARQEAIAAARAYVEEAEAKLASAEASVAMAQARLQDYRSRSFLTGTGLDDPFYEDPLARAVETATAALAEMQAGLTAARERLREIEASDPGDPLRRALGDAQKYTDELGRAHDAMLRLSAAGIGSLRESELRLQFHGDDVGLAGALARERILAEQAPIRAANPELRQYLDEQAEAHVANAVAAERNRQALLALQRVGTGTTGRGGGGLARSDEQRVIEERQRRALAVYEQTRTAAERLAAEERELQALYREGYWDDLGPIAAMETLERALIGVRQQYDPLTQATAEWAGTLKDGLLDALTNSGSLADAMDAVAQSIQRAAWEALLFGEGPLGGLFGGGGGLLGGLLGAIFPSAAVTPSARGNVFADGDLVTAFARGGIVDRATVFPMRGGIGLMGEAGPEAILPLRRGRDGRLGVSAGGGGTEGSAGMLDVRVYVDQDGNWQAAVERLAGPVSAEVTRQGIAQYDKTFNRRARAAVNDRRRV